MSEKKLAEKTLEKQLVDVNVQLYKPFYDFIKEYLAFFGSKQSLEQFCMGAIYDEVCFLYREFRAFVSNNGKQIDPQAWFEKWPHIAAASFEDPEDEES